MTIRRLARTVGIGTIVTLIPGGLPLYAAWRLLRWWSADENRVTVRERVYRTKSGYTLRVVK